MEWVSCNMRYWYEVAEEKPGVDSREKCGPKALQYHMQYLKLLLSVAHC